MTSDKNQSGEKWYNKLLDKAKEYQKQVGELDDNVFDVREKYDEILARNFYLEKEIEERTVELDRAQQSMLTLKHIWETMKSAEPLGNVLSIVCNSLIENLDYNFCCIMQYQKNVDQGKLLTRSYTDNYYLNKLDSALNEPLTSFSIPDNVTTNPLVKALGAKDFIVTKTFQDILDGADPEISPEKIKDLDVILGDKAIVIVPINLEDKPFGVLYAVSQRPEVTDTEKTFLKMFAGQIEVAVTIARLFEQVREQAITDSLTKIANRRHFDQCLAQEAERSLRLNQPFTLITLDMDHLKLINDTHGHGAGDAAIIHMAATLKQNARAIDLPARMGGEEFATMLPGVDLEGGLVAAERIRSAIESVSLEGVGTVTASIGVATFLRHSEDLGELLELADQAMYEAKQTGRNRVCVAKQATRELTWQEVALETFIKVLTEKHSPLTPNMAKDLILRLKATVRKEDSFVDTLYKTVDSLISSVDIAHEQGVSENIVNYSVKLAEKAGLNSLEVDKVRLAALLHDLGKMTLPQNIISKPGPLDEDEWNIILQHPIVAARDILGPLNSLDHITPLIEHHHEHWNGAGYPAKLQGEDIPIGSRIIFIVDSYFAMITDRPYRKALTVNKALEILHEGSNSTWDAKLVELFISIIKEELDIL